VPAEYVAATKAAREETHAKVPTSPTSWPRSYSLKSTSLRPSRACDSPRDARAEETPVMCWLGRQQ